MSESIGHALSAVDAARIIFRTDAPSEEQIGRVYERMRAGVIRVTDRTRPLHAWMTSESALADYLAAERTRKPNRRTPANGVKKTAPPGKTRAANGKQVVEVYRAIWRDYFLAVMLKRRMSHRSRAFHRAVLGGQIALLLFICATFYFGLRFTIAPSRPEQAAIERWIDEHTDSHLVTRWHPTLAGDEPDEVVVEVEYRYTRDSARAIHTKRRFSVKGDVVAELGEDQSS